MGNGPPQLTFPLNPDSRPGECGQLSMVRVVTRWGIHWAGSPGPSSPTLDPHTDHQYLNHVFGCVALLLAVLIAAGAGILVIVLKNHSIPTVDRTIITPISQIVLQTRDLNNHSTRARGKPQEVSGESRLYAEQEEQGHVGALHCQMSEQSN